MYLKYKSIITILLLFILTCGVVSAETQYLGDYSASNKLLLHMNQSPANPTYINDSTNLHIGSTVGNTITDINNRYFGNASANFDGTSIGVYFPDSTDWDCTASDCTWVFWVNTSSLSVNTDKMIISTTGSSGSNGHTAIYSKGTGELAIGIFGTNEVTTSGLSLPINKYSQVVVKRNNTAGTTKMYVNGTMYINTTTAVWDNSDQPLSIGGGFYSTSRYFTGNIDEVSLWKQDIPISDLWPQLKEIGITYGTKYLEKYDTLNKFGLHMNQSPANPTYFNDTTNLHIGSTIGTATTNITTKVFGNASGRFDDGTSSAVYFEDSPDWDCTNSDCTWMFWINSPDWSGNSDKMILSTTGLSGANTHWAIYAKAPSEIAIAVFGTNEEVTSGANFQSNAFKQVVVKRNNTSGLTKIFVNGTEYLSTSTPVWDNSDQPLSVGGGFYSVPRYINAYIDEVYLWKGVDIPIGDLWPQTTEVGSLLFSSSISANFTISNSTGFVPMMTHFTDTSTTLDATIDAWNWSFGDGNVSSLQNVTHTYVNNGTFSVNLTITNTSYSLISTKIQNVTVYNSPPVSNFTANVTSGSPPLAVQFTDTSTGQNISVWNWSFGDGNLSTTQNPIYIYNYIGEYQVNLTVTNDGGSSTKLQNITVELFKAQFTSNQTTGTIPLAIQFNDTSLGNFDSWNWSVDEGVLYWFNKTIYADRNLEYTFNNAGSWRVNLSVQNISESGPIYSASMNITATNVPPVASFIGYPPAGSTSTVFLFNDTSTGVVTYRNWSFGDGNYSSTQNVTHMFPSNGIYNVNLTVSNDGGSSYAVQSFTVSDFSVTTSISPSSGVIPLLVTFNETYSGLIPDSYYWEFGDGSTSTDKNTTHTYTTIGTFDVNHRVVNDSTILWSNTTGAVATFGGSVTANFTANVTSGDYPLDVQFTDTSAYINATPSSWYWVFGDGFTSILQNPSHTYSNAGVYSVNFTTNTDYGSDSMLKPNYISVGGVASNGRQDVILINYHNITLYVKDANSGNLISTATILDELGHGLTSYGNGVFTGSYPTGQHTFTANATNYYTNRATYLVSGNLIQTIYLTQVATSVSTTWYTPKTIQISFTDVYGNQLKGASVNAHYNETTLPNGVSDLISNYGMNANVANEALNGTLIMSGSTDYQGGIVFTMLSTIKYDIAVTYGGNTNYYSIYPQDSQYQFKFVTTVATDNVWDDLYANGNTKVWATEPDAGNITFWWSFQDMTTLTTRIDFYLKDVDSNTMVYITNVTSPVAGNIYQLNYTVPNVRGKNYMIWGNYTRDE